MATSILPHTSSRTPKHAMSSTRPHTSHSTIRCVTPSPESSTEASKSQKPPTSPCETDGPPRPVSMITLSHPRLPEKDSLPRTASRILRPRSQELQGPNLERNLTPTRIPQPTNPILKTSAAPAMSPEESAELKHSHASRTSSARHAAPRRHRPLSMPSTVGSSAISYPLRSPPTPAAVATGGERDKAFTMFPNEDPFFVSSDSAKLVEGEPGDGWKRIESATRSSPLRIHRKPATPQAPPAWKPARQETHTSTLFPRVGQKISPGSVNTAFSTPGRDEMERKKGNLDGFTAEDGPFGRVKDMKELEESRKRIEQRSRAEKKGTKRDECSAGCGCLVM